MAQSHLLSLPKKAVFYESKRIEMQGVTFTFYLYTYANASGFVHFAELYSDRDRKDSDYLSDLAHIADAKAQYYNRSWERYTGQAVFKEAVNWALKSKDITQAEYDYLKEALE